jgi:hypothetical protein
MVSVVNGYVCFTSCDAAAAKQGKNPAAPPGSLPGTPNDKASSFDGQPATVFDGALKQLVDAQALAGGRAPTAADTQQQLNIVI